MTAEEIDLVFRVGREYPPGVPKSRWFCDQDLEVEEEVTLARARRSADGG